MTTGKQHEGRIDIVRTRSNERDDFIQMRLRDVGSGSTVIEIQMTVEDFGLAITGLGGTPCAFNLLDVERVGKRREHKSVCVFVPEGQPHSIDTRIRTAIAGHETDGWKGNDADAKNWHRRVVSSSIGISYDVQYTRFVDTEEEAD